MGEAESTNIEATLTKGVLHLVFTSEDGRNTMDDRWFALLDQALVDADANPAVHVVLLSGKGFAFCSGMNLKHLDTAEFTKRYEGSALARVTERLTIFTKPLVAAVHGSAIGGGATILLHCDLAVAAADTKFRLPFVGLGVVPEFGSTYLLPRAAGSKLASKLLLLGQLFDAQQALSAGILDEVAAPGEELTVARQWAEHLAAQPQWSVRECKRLLRAAQPDGLSAALAREGAALVKSFSRGEIGEAVAAFLEKRPPDYSRFSA